MRLMGEMERVSFCAVVIFFDGHLGRRDECPAVWV